MLSDNIRILGHDFVKNNKNKAKLIINNKKYGLKDLVNYKEFTNDKIKINIILSKDISNISHMFKNCVKLLEISIDNDFININDEKFYKFEEFFDYNNDYNENIYEYYCDNNHDNFYNDNDNIFSNCSEIAKRKDMDINHSNSTISDIKDNIIIHQYNYYSNMSEIFYNCLSLLSLPDISKWNTNNVEDMSGMFSDCSSLLSLPDISKWNTNNVKNMSEIFSHCSSLSSLPDISKWNTNNVEDMSNMFDNCPLLLFITNLLKIERHSFHRKSRYSDFINDKII